MKNYLKRRIFWIKDFFNGGRMWKEYREVRSIIDDPEGSEALLDRKLAEIISFAKSNTKFYSKVAGDSLADFPVIDKNIIRSAYDDFIAADPAECLCHTTSGSTGIPFHAYQDRASGVRRVATIKACNEYIGFHSCMPMMLLRCSEKPDQRGGDFVVDRKSNICFANISKFDDCSMQRVIDKMNSFGARFVRGEMSLIELITAYAVRNGVELSSHPTFISIGELLTEPLRKRIVDEMHLHIMSQYANEENGIFGQNRPDAPGDVIHLINANCIVEILKMDCDEPAATGETGRVVVTDLTNRAMPMIRYDIGDIAEKIDALPSGRITSIRLAHCRKMDRIYDTSGNVGQVMLPYELWVIPTLRQLQFSQLDVKRYRLLLNASCPREQIDVEGIQEMFRRNLGEDAEIEVELTDEIPIMRSGKRKLIIQLCKEYL